MIHFQKPQISFQRYSERERKREGESNVKENVPSWRSLRGIAYFKAANRDREVRGSELQLTVKAPAHSSSSHSFVRSFNPPSNRSHPRRSFRRRQRAAHRMHRLPPGAARFFPEDTACACTCECESQGCARIELLVRSIDRSISRWSQQ